MRSSIETGSAKTKAARDAQQRAKRRFLERIRNAPDRGTNGKIDWTRDELHQR